MKKDFLRFLLLCIALLGLITLNSAWKPEHEAGLVIYALLFWSASFFLFRKMFLKGRKSAGRIFPFAALFFLLIFTLILGEHILLLFT